MAPPSKLHLYGTTGACSGAMHILLHETDLDFTTEIWKLSDIKAQGGYPAAFKALNPKGKVPVLVADDEVLTENIALFTYINQLAPQNNFLGKTPLDTVRAYEWLSYLSGTLHSMTYGMFYRPSRFVDVEDPALEAHVSAKAKTSIQEIYTFIDGKLEGKKWAVGDDFSAVDAYLSVFYRWGRDNVKLEMEGPYPNFTRLFRAVLERPSARKVYEVEGLSLE